MNNLKSLLEYCNKKIEEFPDLKDDILSFYYLAESEIEAGESEVNECQLCESEIEELTKNL